jgi:hypothetical protein
MLILLVHSETGSYTSEQAYRRISDSVGRRSRTMKPSLVHVVILIALLVPCLVVDSVAKTPTQTPAKLASVVRDCAAISTRDPNLASLSAVCEFVKSMDRALPNFTCQQTTQRYVPISAIIRQSEERRVDDIVADTVSATVTYENRIDRYTDIKIGDRPAPQDAVNLAGLTTGDFGSELVSIFLEETAAVFAFRGQENSQGVEEYVFDFRIPAGTNHAFTLREDGSETHPDLEGVLWVSKNTNEVRRLDIRAKNIDSVFSADHIQFSTLFGKVQFGDAGEFLLPSQSETTVCTRRRLCRHNVTQWANCRRLAVKTRIIFGIE